MAEMVKLTIDGKEVSVPKGTNLIEAAKTIGIDIPYYCYHPNLSIAGNCRMCQVEIKGKPKLDIGCNTAVAEGMEVLTQHSSPSVKKAQEATLEFILINHPLDCTVCDQAGHCKLQDYHFDYNAKPSRFLEDKEHKVKAFPLGPTVMLDGERCIMCTRCIRFCDEVTETSELGMLNRGDRAVIAINPGKVLDNPLSGTVVDLCPVGALTHREWRFNTRIWFTKQTDSICPGCSTGCNVKVAERDGKIVQVKAKENQQVNKEWLCDEGRYGFDRFLPSHRVTGAKIDRKGASIADAVNFAASALKGDETIVFVAPDLLTEEYWILKAISEKVQGAKFALAYRERKLTPVEAILISPDYAPNFRGAEFVGLSKETGRSYENALSALRNGNVKQVLVVGDRGILKEDLDPSTLTALSKVKAIGLITDGDSKLADSLSAVVGTRSILEKSGLLINRSLRLQYADRVVDFPQGTEPEWRFLASVLKALGGKSVDAKSDREMTLTFLDLEPSLKGLTIHRIKEGGVSLQSSSASALEQGATAP